MKRLAATLAAAAAIAGITPAAANAAPADPCSSSLPFAGLLIPFCE